MIGGNVVFKDRMWVLGGGTYDTPKTPQRKFFNDVWSSADGVNWQCHLGHAPWAPRQYHEVAVFDEQAGPGGQIYRAIESIPGVRGHHMLRTRRMGQDILVETHVLVAPDLTVSEGHRISDAVRSGIKAISNDIGDVLVHIDPEDDANERPSSNLPDREELLAALTARWQTLEAAQSIEKVNFHYLAGRVDVDIVLPLDLAHDVAHARKLAAELRISAETDPNVGHATIYFR